MGLRAESAYWKRRTSPPMAVLGRPYPIPWSYVKCRIDFDIAAFDHVYPPFDIALDRESGSHP